MRHVGLSNEAPWDVSEFIRCTQQAGLPKVLSIQNAYRLLNRAFENGLAETCKHADVGPLDYSPLAFGGLSGKYLTNSQTRGRMTLFSRF